MSEVIYMYYCYSFKENAYTSEQVKREIERAKEENKYLYYDRELDQFFDQDNQVVDLSGVEVFPVSDSLYLMTFLEKLASEGAIYPTTVQDYSMIKEWYKYIETKRDIVSFTKDDLLDESFLTYLLEVFSKTDVFFKTRTKDYHGIVSLEELFSEDSALRKSCSYHPDEEFIISKKVDIDHDDLGNVEYRAFVYQGEVMNISRLTHKNYHQIPEVVLTYLHSILDHMLPEEFPTTFCLDLFSHQGGLDILEFNPLESSGKYLYNTIFEFSDDLSHSDIEKVPSERKYNQPGYQVEEKLQNSTTDTSIGTFSNDYKNIQSYGERIVAEDVLEYLGNGYCHVFGGSDVQKIDIQELMETAEDVDIDAFAEEMNQFMASEVGAFVKQKKNDL